MKSTGLLLFMAVAGLLVAVPGVGRADVVTEYNFNIPGVPQGGFPSFANSVSIKEVRTGTGNSVTTLLTAKLGAGPFSFRLTPESEPQSITNGSYELSATFDNTGAYIPGTGELIITGELAGYGGTNLYGAKIASFGADTINDDSPMALGFRTFGPDAANPAVRPTGWAAQFQSGSESIYLYNFNVIGFMGNLTSAKFKTATYTGSAVTTVPIPAAAWLFGSALALLCGVRRKKSLSESE